MVFIETPVFTRQLEKLISDESYLEMQQFLSRLPTAGDLIRGSNGCTANLTPMQIRKLGQLVANELKVQ